MKIYFAGPHVFLPSFSKSLHDDHIDYLAEHHNFTALVPKDGDVQPDPARPDMLPLAIYLKNIEDLRNCDAVVADITPFRGVSLDAGTAFEIGFARALNKTVILWSDKRSTNYADRVDDYFGAMGESDNMAIEEFSLTENLMIVPHAITPVFKDLQSATMHVLMIHGIIKGEAA